MHVLCCIAGLLVAVVAMSSTAEIRFAPAASGPGFGSLGWDSEGTEQAKQNLLRPVTTPLLEVERDGAWHDAAPDVIAVESADGHYLVRLRAGEACEVDWLAERTSTGMRWTVRSAGRAAPATTRLPITLHFAPAQAAVCVLPSRWSPPDGFVLPAVLSAADDGQLLITQVHGPAALGRFTGSRRLRAIDVAFELPIAVEDGVALDFAFATLPTPAGVDATQWRAVRRGWWNVYEPCVRGALDNLAPGVTSAPAGVLANNPISDPVSSLYAFIGDHALLIPQLAPGISSGSLLRSALDWWLDARTGADGSVVSYCGMTEFQRDKPRPSGWGAG